MSQPAPPSFYMRSEFTTTGKITAGWLLGNVAGPRPTGYWHVRVDPPLIVGGRPDQPEALLAERWANKNLGALGDGEVIPVFVCIILNPAAVQAGAVTESDMLLVTWADVARDPALLT